MPTTRKKRMRKLRVRPGSAVEDYVHCRITKEELCEAYDNPFVQFVVTSKHNLMAGAQAYEIWCRDGKALLEQYGYKGKFGCYPGTNIVDTGGLPANLVALVGAFGEPWKPE